MVKVKLVEKSVNRTVGRVMVEKVTIQYSRPDMTLAVSNRARPSIASHDDCRWPWRAASIGEACAPAALVAEIELALELAADELNSGSDAEISIIWTWRGCSASKHFDISY